MSVKTEAESREFVMVYVEATPDEWSSDANYLVHGLPKGKSFQDQTNYETIACAYPKINGVAIGTDYLELSEHKRTMEVIPDEDGTIVNIKL